MIAEQATKLALGSGSGSQLNAAIASAAFGTGNIGFSHILKISMEHYA
jgi:hypothetical protein